MSELVLVTGSSRGIGAAIARRFALRPATTVLLCYHEDEAGAEATLSEIRAHGGTAESYCADLADEPSVQRLAREIESTYGEPPTTLVNNAGQIVRPSGWLEISPEDIRRTVDVNLMSVFWTTRAFVPAMIERGSGHVVNLCTTYAINGAAAVLAYTAAKAGVATVTTALAAELGGVGIRVNAVAPGNVDTGMTRSAGEDVVQWSIETTPLGRLGTVDEVADAVLYLQDAKFVTGEILKVDGGQILKI